MSNDALENARRISECTDILNKMIKTLAPGLRIESPIQSITPLQGPTGEYAINVRVQFDQKFSVLPSTRTQSSPPAFKMIPNALFQTLHAQGVKSLSIPNDGENCFDLKLIDLHGAVKGDGVTFERQLGTTYTDLLGRSQGRD